MMNYAVYWEPTLLSQYPSDEVQCVFYPTLAEAEAKIRELILECGRIALDYPEEGIPNWAITLLQQLGEVRPAEGSIIAYFPNK